MNYSNIKLSFLAIKLKFSLVEVDNVFLFPYHVLPGRGHQHKFNSTIL